MNQATGFALTSEPSPAFVPAVSQEPALQDSAMPSDALRVIAHQLRQPLSSIETIAFYLSMVVPHKDEKIQQQLRQIRMLVQQSNRILSEGLTEVPRSDEAPQGDAVTAHVTAPLGFTAA
jgi:signal transduction histidine kinase